MPITDSDCTYEESTPPFNWDDDAETESNPAVWSEFEWAPEP